MNIKDINPWWKTPEIGEYDEFPKRDLFKEILPYVKERQIIAINGLRRMGKTVLMHHIIGHLLKTTPGERVLYYNFDLLDESIEDVLGHYEEIVGVDARKDEVFVFLDEIQKRRGWENELKLLYDNFRKLKFFISGSSSLLIEKKTKESLGGRIFSFSLGPLTFNEYLKLRGIEPGKKAHLLENEMKKAISHYLRTGGFPELISSRDSLKMNRYIKELVVDRVIYIDIPKSFEIDEPELLARMLSIISASPGMIIDYESLADDLGRNRKTISSYMFYLEKAFLVRRVYNYSRNLLTSDKKMKKAYPSSTAFAFLFEAPPGKITETAVLMNQDFRFFSRKGDKEVDFIRTGEKTLPVEVKHSGDVKAREIKGLIKFMGDHGLRRGLVITGEKEGKGVMKGRTIEFKPLWKWMLNP